MATYSIVIGGHISEFSIQGLIQEGVYSLAEHKAVIVRKYSTLDLEAIVGKETLDSFLRIAESFEVDNDDAAAVLAALAGITKKEALVYLEGYL